MSVVKKILPVVVGIGIPILATTLGGPVGAFLGTKLGAFAAAATGALASSVLAKTLATRPRPPGIKIEQTLGGGVNSRSLILGTYATAGSMVAPSMSHGKDGKTPNAYLTKVIAFADAPADGLTRLIIDGEYVPFGGAANEYGVPIGGKYAGNAWVKFYDGRQSAADPSLIARYGNYIRPWTASRIGKGVAYGIFTFKYNADVFKQEPNIKVELRGMRLYDLRKDGSRGGSGAHRLNDQTTWEYTDNGVVMVYNLLCGIPLGDGTRYGGECSQDDLPLSNWAAGMNVCEEIAEGTNEPRYRAALEISVDEEPASVIEEMLKACSASISEVGGIYKVRVGPPSLPVMFVTDEDFIVTRDQDFDPFPAINQSFNTIHGSYPHPDETWNAHDAPPYSLPEYVAQDDGVPLIASLSFPACPYPLQVQRNMRAWLQDDRRWRRHTAAFGPYAFILEPLDTIAWSSARNGYENKLFEIDSTAEDMRTLLNTIALREVDPADYDWRSEFELPDPVSPGSWLLPEVQAVPGFSVQPWSIKDGDGDNRRPAIRVAWTPDGAEDAKLLKIQVRLLATQAIICDVTVTNVTDGEKIISESILGATSYEVRAQYIVDRPTEWTSWLGVTTGNLLFTNKDFDFDELVREFGRSNVVDLLYQNTSIDDIIIQQILDVAFTDLGAFKEKATEIKAFAETFDAKALVAVETIARIAEGEALASETRVVGVQVRDAVAQIVDEREARVTAEEASAQFSQAVVARFNANEAAIGVVNQARVDGDSANAYSIQQVSVRFDDYSASVTEAFRVQGDAINGFRASYTLRINNNGKISGFGLASDPNGNSEFAVLAHRFIIANPDDPNSVLYPFQVVNGAVYIRKAFAEKIQAEEIEANSISTRELSINGVDYRNLRYGAAGLQSWYSKQGPNDNPQTEWGAGPVGTGITCENGDPIRVDVSIACYDLNNTNSTVYYRVVRKVAGYADWPVYGGVDGIPKRFPGPGDTRDVSFFFIDAVDKGVRAQYDVQFRATGGANIRSIFRTMNVTEQVKQRYNEFHLEAAANAGPGGGDAGGGNINGDMTGDGGVSAEYGTVGTGGNAGRGGIRGRTAEQ